jgi:hypothetical protein
MSSDSTTKLFYVVSDESGVYITDEPWEGDEIHGVYPNADEASMALCREYELRGE